MSLFNIKDFKLKNFSEKDRSGVIKDYKWDNFSSECQKDYEGNMVKTEDLKDKKNDFKILPVIMEHSHLKQQRLQEEYEIIEEKVNEKVKACKDKAHREGFKAGREEGVGLVKNELLEKMGERIENFTKDLEVAVLGYRENLLSEKYKVYNLVKTLTKWVILKELKGDNQYLERIVEKLIFEINDYSNLTFKVRKKDFDQFCEIFNLMKKKFEKIENVKVNIIQVENNPLNKGIVVESENEILNATFKAQFKALDKLFEQLESHNES